MEKIESENYILLRLTNNFIYNEQVEIINKKCNIIYEGIIISFKGENFIIYNKQNKKEEKYNLNQRQIQKYWKPGLPFLKYNLIVIKLLNSFSFSYFGIGIILDFDKIKNQILVEIHSNIFNINDSNHIFYERINVNSKRIFSFLSYFYLFKKKYFYFQIKYKNKNKYILKENNNKCCFLCQENLERFLYNIEKNKYEIKKIKNDGNCMFRAVSDQVYGKDEYHQIIREKCVEYILLDKEYFSQFIDGGEKEFDDYIRRMKKNGIWGDDVELKALSEIYKRNIHIFIDSYKPTVIIQNKRNKIKENEEKNNLYNKNIINAPIRLFFFCGEHYNSVVPTKFDYKLWLDYKNCIICEEPGVYEDKILIQKRNIK